MTTDECIHCHQPRARHGDRGACLAADYYGNRYEVDDDDADQLPLPLTPYAGTSGWSGSETSQERAVNADDDGTTADHQARTLRIVGARESIGTTWRDLSNLTGWHHGTSSGVLSVLHKEGRIARLAERRDRCQLYVLPEHVDGRETRAQGRKGLRLTDAEQAALDRLANSIDHHGRFNALANAVLVGLEDATALRDALRRLT